MRPESVEGHFDKRRPEPVEGAQRTVPTYPHLLAKPVTCNLKTGQSGVVSDRFDA
jgi:hypothetical protein